MDVETSLLSYYSTFPGFYRIDVTKPLMVVTTDIVNIIDSLHGTVGASRAPLIPPAESNVQIPAERLVDFMPEGPAVVLKFIRSKVFMVIVITRRILNDWFFMV